MASLATAAWFAAQQHAITWQEAVSGIFGSVSLTAWICLLLPQLIANYKAKNADGLSMAFLIVWMLGDAANLIGALLTKLAPTAVALAVYFCILDGILIAQTGYYKARAARRAAAANEQAVIDETDEPTEEAPLLTRRRSSFTDLPGSQIRHSRHEESFIEPIRKVVTGEDETSERHPWLNNLLGLLAVYVVGFLGWFISYRAGAWDSNSADDADGTPLPDPNNGAMDRKAMAGLILGYVSAVLYLCARLPQIYKNYQEKSCEGLSLLFFLLSLTGNFTYGISLIAYSQEKSYLITTIPWLLGSLGTMVEDSAIFLQFRLYANNARNVGGL